MVFYGETAIQLSGGDSISDNSTLHESYLLMSNPDEYELNSIIGNDRYNQVAIELAELRQDCIAFIGLKILPTQEFFRKINYTGELGLNVMETLVDGYYDELLIDNGEYILVESPVMVDDVIDFSEYEFYMYQIEKQLENLNKSKYAFISVNMKKLYDRFYSKYIWVNTVSDVAGIYSSNENLWNQLSGITYGQIKYESLLLKFNKSYLDKLYKMRINTINQGYIQSEQIYIDEKTSFNKLNVRSVTLYITNVVKKLLKNYIFDFNDKFIRNRLGTDIKLLLEDVKYSRGIESGKVVVSGDGQNIDINIYIKPLYVSEFIKLNIANSGVSEDIKVIS